jgi:hypothetical protein
VPPVDGKVDHVTTDQPPPSVLRAFGLPGDPEHLAGGKGGTWRCGPGVLKPAEGQVETDAQAGHRTTPTAPTVDRILSYAGQ